MRSMMRTLKLTVNEKKTHLCRLPDESFDFLGYTFGRCYSTTNGIVATLANARRGRRSGGLPSRSASGPVGDGAG